MTLSLKQPKRGFNLFANNLLLSAPLLTLFAVPGSAAPTRPAQASVSQIIERYIGVTGGAAAWHEKKSERDEIEGRALDSGRVVLRASIALTRAGDSVNDVTVPEEAREGVYKGVAWTWTKPVGSAHQARFRSRGSHSQLTHAGGSRLAFPVP